MVATNLNMAVSTSRFMMAIPTITDLPLILWTIQNTLMFKSDMSVRRALASSYKLQASLRPHEWIRPISEQVPREHQNP